MFFNQQVTDVLLFRLQTRRTCVQDPGLPATLAPAPGPRGPAQPQPQPGPQEPVLGPGTAPEVARVSGSLVTPVSRLEFRDLLDPPTRCLRPRTLRIPDARDPKWFIPTEKTPFPGNCLHPLVEEEQGLNIYNEVFCPYPRHSDFLSIESFHFK